MTRRSPFLTLFAAGSAMLLVGCMPKMTLEDMQAMKPVRAAELDNLNVFVGKWETTGEVRFAGLDEVIVTTGTNETKWDESGFYLVERGDMNMEGFDPMNMRGTWTYDSHAKKYRNTWTGSDGSIGTGTSTYNEKTGVWTWKAKSHGAHGTMYGKGTAKLVDNDTMEWTWTESVMGGLFKIMEINGTSRRK